jgi:hypothetical protein
MTFCRVLLLAAALAVTAAYPAYAQFGGMPGMPGSPGMGGSPFGGPPAGPPPACQELMSLRDQTQKDAGAIQAANKRHATAGDACKLFKVFLGTEAKFMTAIQQNSAQCGVPPEVLKQVHDGHEHATQLAKQVCDVAAQGGPRPAGPSLSDALGSATVPDATTTTKSGRGTFDTLTGNALAK